jgi:hypothetical protein
LHSMMTASVCFKPGSPRSYQHGSLTQNPPPGRNVLVVPEKSSQVKSRMTLELFGRPPRSRSRAASAPSPGSCNPASRTPGTRRCRRGCGARRCFARVPGPPCHDLKRAAWTALAAAMSVKVMLETLA